MSDERLEESSVSQGHSAACLAEESDFNREMRESYNLCYNPPPPIASVVGHSRSQRALGSQDAPANAQLCRAAYPAQPRTC